MKIRRRKRKREGEESKRDKKRFKTELQQIKKPEQEEMDEKRIAELLGLADSFVEHEREKHEKKKKKKKRSYFLISFVRPPGTQVSVAKMSRERFKCLSKNARRMLNVLDELSSNVENVTLLVDREKEAMAEIWQAINQNALEGDIKIKDKSHLYVIPALNKCLE